MKKILCLGDSITDCHRLFIDSPLGCGYVSILAKTFQKLGFELEFINLGVDGFTISRLLEKCESQYLPQNADIITILIGINDIGLMMNTNRTPLQQQEMLKNFLSKYRELLRSFNHAQIILMEPFIFPYPAEFRNWFPLVRQMSEGIQTLAHEFYLPFIPLHDSLNLEGQRYGMETITTDGIHITRMGHEIIAEKLLHTLERYV